VGAVDSEFVRFALGAAINLVVAILIVRFIYYPHTHEKKYVLTFLAFNTIIYFVIALLATTELGVGVGFGLFAIFSVLRYRTDPLPIREMTYLFIIIALPVVNSTLSADGAVWPLVLANATVTALMCVLERGWGFQFEASSRINYDRIDLIQPSQRDELLADLRLRTGLPVKRVEIGRLDFLRDSAQLRVYYDAPRGLATVGAMSDVTNGDDDE